MLDISRQRDGVIRLALFVYLFNLFKLTEILLNTEQ